MLRRAIAGLALIAIAGAFHTESVSAHAGLLLSDPAEGATLGDAPATVRLTFSEKPELSFSEIRVLDTRGASQQVTRAAAAPGDPLSLFVRVRPLPRGVYVVSYRVVSAVDGHVTTGAYAFGVGMAPGSVASPSARRPSGLEIAARWILIGGLIVLIGAAGAHVARFGRSDDVALAACGWLCAAGGTVLLGMAQGHAAGASPSELMRTAIGRALVWRAAALAAAAVALLLGWLRPHMRRHAMSAVIIAALAAIAAHVHAGHAAAGGNWSAVAAAVAQCVHFAAAGMWLGGLAALLRAVRGAPSRETASAVRRFSDVAAGSLVLVLATGLARLVGSLTSSSDLLVTAYGRTLLVKILLTLGIAGLGALNRVRNVVGAAIALGPLRRVAAGELLLGAGVVTAAAILTTLSPPAAASNAPPGLSASGADFATTMRVMFTAVSSQPGPNRFAVRVLDYDSNKPVNARRVSLRFLPLDDPGIPSSTLALAPAPGGSYVGSGANLAFDGRWRVTVQIQTGTSSVDVPVDVEANGGPQFVSVTRIPGRAPAYMVEVERMGNVRFSPDPERPGPSRVSVTAFNVLRDEWPVESLIITAAAGTGAARPQPAQRTTASTFVANVGLQPGVNRLTAVIRPVGGMRLRATVDIVVPAR